MFGQTIKFSLKTILGVIALVMPFAVTSNAQFTKDINDDKLDVCALREALSAAAKLTRKSSSEVSIIRFSFGQDGKKAATIPIIGKGINLKNGVKKAFRKGMGSLSAVRKRKRFFFRGGGCIIISTILIL